MDELLFSVKNLSKRFNKNVIALDNVSFFGKRNSIIGIVGPNGSGKTTLLSIMAGLLNQNNGSIEISKGLSIGANVGDVSFFPYLTALENLKFISQIRGIKYKEMEHNLKEILNLVGVEQNKKADTFSFGMRQRYAIASTLVGTPDIILLDEPTIGIDPIDIEDIKYVIKEASVGKNLIFSSHQLDEVLSLSDYILGLSYGQMLFFDSISTIKEDALANGLLEKQYLLQKIKGN